MSINKWRSKSVPIFATLIAIATTHSLHKKQQVLI